MAKKKIRDEPSVYEKAAALWVSRNYFDSKHQPLKLEYIRDVNFDLIDGCDTCGYPVPGITFYYNGQHRQEDWPVGMTPGKFIEQCVTLLTEVEE